MRVPAGPRRRRRAATGTVPEIGRLAVDRRLALGLTQADLADLAGVGLSSVRALEAGQESLTLAVAVRIVDALGLAIALAPRPDLLSVSTAVVLRPASGLSVKGSDS